MRRLGALVTGVLLTIAAPAFAQDTSRAEFSAGWRYYHATLGSTVRPIQVQLPNDFPNGWYADAAVNLSPKFALVGEAGGTYDNREFNSTTGPLSIHESLDLRFHTFMGGVRVRAPQIPWFVPFGQVLVGGIRNEVTSERTLTVFQNTSSSRGESSSSNAALGLDGGSTITVGFIGVRTTVGYARFFGQTDSDAFRFSLGAAFRF